MGSSGVGDADYSQFQPLNKKETKSNDQLGKHDRYEAPRAPAEPKRVHDPRNAKQALLTSDLDQPRSYAPKAAYDEPTASPVKGRYETQTKKLQNLTSNINNLHGANANAYYHAEQNKGELIHIKLAGLGPHSDEYELKAIANCKHVISSEVEVDNVKGTCRGTGSIKIRLNDGDDKEAIRQRFVNKGYIVQDHQCLPQKDSTFTKPIY